MDEPGDEGIDEPSYLDVMEEENWAAAPFYDEKIASGIIDIVDSHFLHTRTHGLAETIFKAWQMYNSMDSEGTTGTGGFPVTGPQFLGEQGEFTYLPVNHFRNAVRHKLSLITSERPAFEPHASTNDSDSIEQVGLAGNVLDYVMDQRGLNQELFNAAEAGSVMGSAFIHLGWDHHEGDMTAHSLTPLEVVHQQARNWRDVEWVVVRTYESRWRLAAEADNAGNRQLGIDIAEADFSEADYQYAPIAYYDNDTGGSRVERIPVYHFYHKRTPHMPDGRYTRVTGDSLILEDGPTPFAEIPVYRYAPSEFIGTATPFANSWDVMPIHTMSNAVLSAIVSRIDAFGVNNVTVTEGTEVGVDDLNGLTLTTIPPGFNPPVPMDLLPNNPMLPNTWNMIQGIIDDISGVNSVVKGNPADNITSGSMAALVEAQAVKFASPEEAAWTFLCEQAGGGSIKMFQSFADEEMLITVSGEDQRIVQTFKKDRLSQIERVSVQRTNPLTKTNAWKQEAATNLLAQGAITSPDEFLGVIQTGRYKSLFSDSVSLLALIKDENQRMAGGEPVESGELERHDLHITEHAAKLDSRLRENKPEAAMALQQHIIEHLSHWMKMSATNPGMLQALGMQPLALPPMVQQQMAQAGAPPEGGGEEPKPAGKPGPDAKPKGANSAAGTDKEPGMPSAPTNPSTGEKADI